MTLFRTPVVLIFLAACGLLLLSGCKADDMPSESSGKHVVSVRVSEVTGGEAQEITLRFSGIVRSTQRATLTFQVSGTLKERAVELGQTVTAGDVLARACNPGLVPGGGWAVV